jgi:hypothetical protein
VMRECLAEGLDLSPGSFPELVSGHRHLMLGPTVEGYWYGRTHLLH